MKIRFLTFLLLTCIAMTTLEGCKSTNNGRTKGRQQPKKGRIPCPMKDC